MQVMILNWKKSIDFVNESILLWRHKAAVYKLYNFALIDGQSLLFCTPELFHSSNVTLVILSKYWTSNQFHYFKRTLGNS